MVITLPTEGWAFVTHLAGGPCYSSSEPLEHRGKGTFPRTMRMVPFFPGIHAGPERHAMHKLYSRVRRYHNGTLPKVPRPEGAPC